MSWKEKYQLQDMTRGQTIGFVCKSCNLSQPSKVGVLLETLEGTLYLDEVEKAQKCRAWNCGGDLRMELSHDIIMEGFQGGLA